MKGEAMAKANFIEIHIEMANDAFEINQGHEVARILRAIAAGFEHMPAIPADMAHPILDANGNTAGHVRTKPIF